jgi:hypothetical protein
MKGVAADRLLPIFGTATATIAGPTARRDHDGAIGRARIRGIAVDHRAMAEKLFEGGSWRG